MKEEIKEIGLLIIIAFIVIGIIIFIGGVSKSDVSPDGSPIPWMGW